MRSLLLALALSLAPPAHAIEAKIIGGPGYLLWHSEIQGEGDTLAGWGGGISGLGFLQLGEHFRCSVGMYHGSLERADHGRTDRHLFSGGARGVLPLIPELYLSGGLEVGASHLEVAETLGYDAQGRSLVRYTDTWHFMLHPVATVGYRPTPTYHLELLAGLPLERHREGWHRSFTLMVGLFFWMGDED